MAAPPISLHHRHYSSYPLTPPSLYNPSKTPHLLLLKLPKQQHPLNPSKNLTPTLKTSSDKIIPTHLSSSLQNPQSNNETHIEQAREAVAEYLEQLGASRDDAVTISLSCPNYIDMLVDAVNDLDEFHNWSSGMEIDEQGPGFKTKVCQMAEKKGDKGVVPYLESVGLSLSSAMHLARYLLSSSSGSNALPLIMRKVEYVKEIFFGSDDDGGGNELIAKNARRMMAHLSVLADDDVQQTLAFFEKIQARRGGLNLLGSEHASLRYLIESFPRLLFLPIESRVKPIVNFLESIGVPSGYVRNVLLLFPPILFCDLKKDIKPRLRAFEEIGAKDGDIGRMLVKYPWISSTSILENFEQVLDLFDAEKVPTSCSADAIRNWPHILGCSVAKLKLMVEQLGEMGIEDKKLGKVIGTSPQLLLRKRHEFVQVVSFFKDLGLSEEEISRTLVRCPEIFAANVDKTLEKKLEFLIADVGISKTHLPRVIRKYPELFVCDVDQALLPRIRYLLKVGLSKKDIGFMVGRFSPLLGYSIEEVLRPKLQFLVHTMRRPVRDVVDYPRYFSYSLEKKIKPRYWVLKGRNIEFTLKEMLGKNDEEFADAYLGIEEMLVPPT